MLTQVKKFCKVCQDARKSETEYTSHNVRETKDPRSKILCPTLLTQECRRCFQKGHTVKYCSPRRREVSTVFMLFESESEEEEEKEQDNKPKEQDNKPKEQDNKPKEQPCQVPVVPKKSRWLDVESSSDEE